jgi:oligo-1,6-glucosidase
MMTWWLDKGIDGFRLDVINCISKPVEMPDVSPSSKKYEWAGKYFINEPDVHKYIKEMYEKVLSKYDILTVGQTLDVSPENALLYNQSEKKQIEMVFHFELDHIDEGPGGKWEEKKWRLSEFKRIINKWQVGQYNKGWNSVYFGNHDQPRMVSRFGNDSIYRIASAKMLATLQLTLGGTPYIFQGDEIGMTNMTFRTIEDFRDIEATKYYKSALENGMGKFEILSNIRRKSRDNGRTPMQWNGTDNAGFSQGKPWIGVNRNYHYINVENDLKKKDSIINYYRRLIMLRRDYPTFVYGNFTLLCEDSEEIMVYLRESDENCFLVVLNFTDKHIVYEQPVELKKYYSSLLIGNLKDGNYFLQNKSILEPYEALVFKLL